MIILAPSAPPRLVHLAQVDLLLDGPGHVVHKGLHEPGYSEDPPHDGADVGQKVDERVALLTVPDLFFTPGGGEDSGGLGAGAAV